MSDLQKKYRAAPRQVSPPRLDELILARAEQKIPRSKRSPLFSPWKAVAASFCVVSIGFGLLLRFGVPPLDRSHDTAALDESVTSSTLQLEKSIRKQETPLQAPVTELAGNFPDTNLTGVDLPAVAISSQETAGGPSSADTEQMESIQAAPQARQSKAVVPPLSLNTLPAPEPTMVTDGLELEKKRGRSSVESFAASVEVVSENQSVADQVTAIDLLAGDSDQSSSESSDSSLRSEMKQRNLNRTLDDSAEISDALDDSSLNSVVQSAFNWAQSQPETSFTLQLASASDPDYLRRFGESLGLEKLHVVELKANLQESNYGLFYGVFEDSDAAMLRLNTLDETATQFDPWVRSFRRLRSQIKSP